MNSKPTTKAIASLERKNKKHFDAYFKHLNDQGFSQYMQRRYKATAIAVQTKMMDKRLYPPDLS